MNFELLLRHEFLVIVGATGAPKSEFAGWLAEPRQRRRLEAHYRDQFPEMAQKMVLAHWQDPFKRGDERQYSFAGFASPSGLRYQVDRWRADDKSTWISVLFEYATMHQWERARTAKRASIDQDIAAYDLDGWAYKAALDRLNGDLFARCIDGADGATDTGTTS